MHTKTTTTTSPARTSLAFIRWGLVGMLLLLPFHALLTTWIGSSVGSLDAVRLWKEVLLLGMSMVAAVLLIKHPGLRSILRDRIAQVVLAYILLHLTLGIWAYAQRDVSVEALLFGLILNLRFFVAFGLAWLVAQYGSGLQRPLRLILYPTAAVIAFGILQAFVLPYDFLSNFGYGPDTIQAYYTVDNKLEYLRIQSTLRGPNPLGAYLLFVIALLTGILLNRRNHKLLATGMLVLAVAALGFSHSRSAYIGTVLSVGLLIWWWLPSVALRRAALVAGMVAVLALGGGVYLLRDNDLVQNVLFHTDGNSQSAQSSNAARVTYIAISLQDVRNEPLGRGPGTAGPASIRNTERPGRLSENYFLQIAQEGGVVGLGLFVAINIMVGARLWRQQTVLARGLVASLIGISVVNLFLHGWADDTISLLWWTLAGFTIGSAYGVQLVHSKQKTNTSQSQKALNLTPNHKRRTASHEHPSSPKNQFTIHSADKKAA